MNGVVVRPWRTAAWRRVRGFTLIEVMITVAIIAILAAIAMPNYTEYITRGKLLEATTKLSNARQRAEQLFLDTRDYTQSCPPAAVAENKAKVNFDITCVGSTASSYTLQADSPGLGFTYTVDEKANKITVKVPSGWTASATCWTLRRNGDCS